MTTPMFKRGGSPQYQIRKSDRIFAFAFLTPAIFFTIVVVIVPLLYAFYLSFNKAEVVVVAGRGGVVATWVWFKNYLYFLGDPSFWKGVRLTAYFTFVSLAIEMVLGIGVALVLNQQFWGRRMVRTLIILPWAIPTIVNARLWGLIFEPQPYGALNGLLQTLGLIGPRDAVNFLTPVPLFQGVWGLSAITAWLGATSAISWIIVADTWKVLPVVVLLVLAGLQTIPRDLYEAAEMDGANAWQRFWALTFPLLRPILMVILVLRTMELFRVFDILYILMAYTIPVVAVRTFQEAFVFGLFGRGAALAFIIGLFILSMSAVYIRLMYVEEER